MRCAEWASLPPFDWIIDEWELIPSASLIKCLFRVFRSLLICSTTFGKGLVSSCCTLKGYFSFTALSEMSVNLANFNIAGASICRSGFRTVLNIIGAFDLTAFCQYRDLTRCDY